MQTLQISVVLVAGITFGHWILKVKILPQYTTGILENGRLIEGGLSKTCRVGVYGKAGGLSGCRRGRVYFLNSYRRCKPSDFLYEGRDCFDGIVVFYSDMTERNPAAGVFHYGLVAEASLDNEDSTGGEDFSTFNIE